jgi:hypothetical protein
MERTSGLIPDDPHKDANDAIIPRKDARPRASTWQIAGVWIAGAGLLLSAAKFVIDVWMLATP